jgi:hypothetical protein
MRDNQADYYLFNLDAGDVASMIDGLVRAATSRPGGGGYDPSLRFIATFRPVGAKPDFVMHLSLRDAIRREYCSPLSGGTTSWYVPTRDAFERHLNVFARVFEGMVARAQESVEEFRGALGDDHPNLEMVIGPESNRIHDWAWERFLSEAFAFYERLPEPRAEPHDAWGL